MELASVMLSSSITYKINPKLSMLVIGVTIKFTKKAVGIITFECIGYCYSNIKTI